MQKKVYYYIFLFFILMLTIASCREMWGDHPLGNNFDLLEGDKPEDRIIVYCTNKKGGICYGGIPVVPTYERQFDEGKYAEYIEAAKSNRDWIIAKSIQIKNKEENYWIISKNFDIQNFNCEKINCDSIIHSNVRGPLDYDTFKIIIKRLNIDLSFK